MAGKVTLATIIVFLAVKVSVQTLQDDIGRQINNTAETVVLSRKRRYLIFPEGSSLQLVFCLTIPSVGMGNIFTIGSTAALAWELPHDPFVPFRKPAEVLHRIDSNKGDSSDGAGILQYSYMSDYNPFLVDQTLRGAAAVAGRKPVSYSTIEGAGGWKRRKSNHNRVYNEPVTAYLHPVYHQIYRRTRRDLYSKIEKLFTSLSRDGRACLLKAVCEVGKASQKRGTFMEEIIKAIFRVRHSDDKINEDEDEYDAAAGKQHNCTEMYPTCQHSIWDGLF